MNPDSILTLQPHHELTEREKTTLSRRAQFFLAMLEFCSPPTQIPTDDELRSLSTQLKNLKVIDRCFLAAMVCAGHNDRSLDLITGHILAASLHDLDQGRRSHVAKHACRIIRLMHQGANPELREPISEIIDTDSNEVLRNLIQHRLNLQELGQYNLVKRLSPIVSLLERYVNDRVINRNVDPPSKRHTQLVAPLAEIDFETDPESNPGTAKMLSYYDPDIDGDIESARTIIDFKPSGPPAHRRSLPAQNYYAKAATAQIVRGYMMSPQRWGVLSGKTLQALVQALRDGIDNQSPVDALLLISLLTGRSIDRLKQMKIIRLRVDVDLDVVNINPKKKVVEVFVRRIRQMALRTGLVLPIPGVAEQYLKYYLPSRTYVNLPLPHEALPCLTGTDTPYVSQEEVNERLRSLRQNFPQITAARIASAGHQWLYHNGLDRTVLNRLFDTNLAHAVPLYYENMREERVLVAYKKWYSHINTLSPDKHFTIERLPRISRIGSQRTPKKKIIENLFAEYRKYVLKEFQTGKLYNSHNHYAVYTYLILSLATGLRPVRQPFETFSDYCCETNTYFIRDKDAPGTPSPRFVPVASFATKQLSDYRSHLQWLKTQILGSNDKQIKYINAALGDIAPYLFTFNENEDPEPLTPSSIETVLEHISPLDLNWPRHLLRTELTDCNVHDDVIQAFMGHGEMGQEPFAHYSATTMADLNDVSNTIEELAAELNITPLSLPAGYTRQTRPPLKSNINFGYIPQRDVNAIRRKRKILEQKEQVLNWVRKRIADIKDEIETYENEDKAIKTQQQLLSELDNAFPHKFGWTFARYQLAKELEILNDKHGLGFPIQTLPKMPRRIPLMHNEKLFNARKVVQYIATEFVKALSDPANLHKVAEKDLLPLVLFSAACFGALAEPEALLACGQSFHKKMKLNYEPANQLCWIEFDYETDKSNNVLEEGQPRCMRRFFLDGITLILLIHYFRRPTDQAESFSTPYQDKTDLIRQFRICVKRFCGAELPKKMSLHQFCMGAVCVAENQPGVRLPHYLTECANGRIDSVSLPAQYFHAYLGATPILNYDNEELEVNESLTSFYDPNSSSNVKLKTKPIRELFTDFPSGQKFRIRAALIGRINDLLSTEEELPLCTEHLVEWFRHLLTDRGLATLTPYRYSNWITTPWLIQFEGLNLNELTGDAWYERYEAIIEQAPEKQRNSVAGRLMDLHQFLHKKYQYAKIPGDLQRLHMRQRMVRARIIPERIFAAFINALQASKLDPSIRWIFTLCYRLGTRISETTRILLSDIEQADDPLIMLRANRFGTPKTKTPHQLRFNPFLPESERHGFHEWLDIRRKAEGSKSKNELVFALPDTDAVIWNTKELEKLFTTLMFKVSGMHFSPHDCRHSTASRLIWICEGETPPDECAYTDSEINELRQAIFTATPNCRDRIWHLAAVLNHASPETTFANYIHFTDMLLYYKLRHSLRRLPPKTLSSILNIRQKNFTHSKYCDPDGFLVAQVLPIVYKFNKKKFAVLNIQDPHIQLDAPDSKTKIEIMDSKEAVSFGITQRILEELENGQEPEAIANSFNVAPKTVKLLQDHATYCAEKYTREGKSRLFSNARRKTVSYPLSPTRLRSAEDQELVSTLIPRLREVMRENPDWIAGACAHFLKHTFRSNSGLRFHSLDELKQFLSFFLDKCKREIPMDRWLIRVSSVPTKTKQELVKDWTVHEKISVHVIAKKKANVKHPHNVIAYLHLQKKETISETGKFKDTSSALKYLLHMLCIYIDPVRIEKANDKMSAAD